MLIPSLELVSYLIGCRMSSDANNSLCSVDNSKNSEATSRAPFMTDLLTPWFITCSCFPPQVRYHNVNTLTSDKSSSRTCMLSFVTELCMNGVVYWCSVQCKLTSVLRIRGCRLVTEAPRDCGHASSSNLPKNRTDRNGIPGVVFVGSAERICISKAEESMRQIGMVLVATGQIKSLARRLFDRLHRSPLGFPNDSVQEQTIGAPACVCMYRRACVRPDEQDISPRTRVGGGRKAESAAKWGKRGLSGFPVLAAVS